MPIHAMLNPCAHNDSREEISANSRSAHVKNEEEQAGHRPGMAQFWLDYFISL